MAGGSGLLAFPRNAGFAHNPIARTASDSERPVADARGSEKEGRCRYDEVRGGAVCADAGPAVGSCAGCNRGGRARISLVNPVAPGKACNGRLPCYAIAHAFGAC